MARLTPGGYAALEMSSPENITSAIVDTLYETALDLAEHARGAFEAAEAGLSGDAGMRAALSRQALRTNTQLMHAMAWLLNHRAYFAGDMSEAQLRRHGALPPAAPERPDRAHDAFDPALRDVIERTRDLHARIARLDAIGCVRYLPRPAAVHRLHDRLGQAFG